MFSNPIASTTKKTPKTKKRSFNQSDGENKQENILSDIIGDVLNKVLEKATSKKEELLEEKNNVIAKIEKNSEEVINTIISLTEDLKISSGSLFITE
jgi:hypothetical protein